MAEAVATHPPIRAAQLEDASAAADILAEAFANDPVMKWTMGSLRPVRTVFFELARGVYLKSGFVHIADDAGVTLWLPAGGNAVIPFTNELRIAAAAFLAGGVETIIRAKKTIDIMEASHPSRAHYYLFAVGVRDKMRGKGIGGELIREGLRLADEADAPAYLENSNPQNTPLYERLGFRATAPLQLPKGAPPLLGMLHESAAP